MPTQVAGVVEHRDPRRSSLPVELQPAALQEIPDQFAVVDHLQFQAVLAVIVLQDGEAVGALGNHLRHPLLPQQCRVFRGQTVEDVFVAEPAQAVAAALFLPAEYPPGDSRTVEYFGQGKGDLLVARVEGAGAADEEEVLGFARLERPGLHAGAPLGSLRWCDPPRVGAVLHVLEKVEQLLRKAALHLHQVAAQRHYFGHLFDADRAGREAGAAGGAVPDSPVTDRAFGVVADERDLRFKAAFEAISVCQQVGLDGMNHLPGVEGLAGGSCRAGLLAASALSAGE